MMHFNGIMVGMWVGVVFTSPYHSICYLSFYLKLEGMNFVADNYTFLQIIDDTNMILRNFFNVFTCLKECLNMYMNILQCALKDSLEFFQGLSFQVVSQVQN